MDWRDEGILIGVRRHGESAAVIEVFTAGHGRHAGVVRGGAGRRMAPVLQPGARLQLEWTARLEEHLGHFRVEPLGGSTAAVMADRAALAALGRWRRCSARRCPNGTRIRGSMQRPPIWSAARHGGGLAGALCGLGAGAARRPRLRARPRGLRGDRGGRRSRLGVAAERTGGQPGGAGAPWADRLLPLPAFLRGGWEAPPPAAEVAAALALTGHFLEARLAPGLRREALPPARARAVEAIRRAGG